ncbi:piggyBac transposable element-derived protein 4 [Trichonephila clavipes]|nr:piggyBac transposable element-derived protein 4 [Trichonephila clavipes]
MNSDSENECLIEERSSDEEFSSSESESDDDCLDSARDWCQIDVTSPLPSHPKFPFTGNPGIKVCIGDSGDPFEYFNLFLDDEMLSFIVEETNRYAESFFENAELTPGSRALKWKNTNKEEMKRFIALLFLQGVVQKPVEQWFWSKRPILSTPFFGKVMGELCESESGYIWNSLIYTGKGTAFNENYNDYGLSTKSVLTLIHELKGKGYCLSTDNFYTSPELAELLIDSKTDICGTLRPNRKGLPVSFKSSTLKKGEIIAFQKVVIQNDNFVPEISPYLKKFAKFSTQIREVVEEQHDSRKFYADKMRKAAPTYQPGEHVFVASHPLSNAAQESSAKLMSRRDGPYVILTQRSPSSYEIASLDNPGEPLGFYHTSALTPCTND